MTCLALVGFGEVGQRLAADFRSRPDVVLRVWDRQFSDPDGALARVARAADLTPSTSLAHALHGVSHVISAVTADQAVAVAREAAATLRAGTWYVDLNSVAPASRKSAAEAVQRSGARYLEAAVMSPIAPRGLASPILLGGPHARAFSGTALGFTGARVYANELGRASAAKLCRSVVIKGLEALMVESLCAARHYGVDGDVLESLRDAFTLSEPATLAQYLLTRTLQHGARRADEMAEAAATLRQAGVEPWLAEATVRRQRWAADRGLRPPYADSLADLIDATRAETAC